MSAGSRVILADTPDRAGGPFVPPRRAPVSFTRSGDRSDTDDPAQHRLMPGGVLAAAPPSTPAAGHRHDAGLAAARLRTPATPVLCRARGPGTSRPPHLRRR